jgi:hypothetical protein
MAARGYQTAARREPFRAVRGWRMLRPVEGRGTVILVTRDRGRASRGSLALCGALCACLISGPSALRAQEHAGAAEDGGAESSEELNRQLNNPVSSIWSLNFQHNTVQMKNTGTDLPVWHHGNSEWFYNLNFQPVIPLELSESWNLISRPVFPIYGERAVFDDGHFQDESGLGDITFFSLLSPAQAQGGLLWGAGPSFIFPSATRDALGQEKWQAGPAAVALHLGREWIYGVLGQHWWSMAGADDRPETNQSNVQYFLFRLLPGQWQVGLAPNITVDWKADDGNEVSFPIGLGFGKLVRLGKLPVKFTFEVDYAVVHPDDIGQGWSMRLQMIPVLPNLVKGPLLGR